MSDRQRRSVCRVSFLLFGVLPTLLVAGYLLWPTPTIDWERQASQMLDWKIDIASHALVPNSGGTQFTDVQIHDPRLGLLATLEYAEWQGTEAGQVIVIEELSLPREHALLLAKDLTDRFLLRQRVQLPPTQVLIHQLTLTDSVDDQQTAWRTFEDVHLTWAPAAETLEIELTGKPAGGASDDAVQLSLSWPRISPSTPANTIDSLPARWRFETGRQPMHCGLLAAWLPFVEHWGTEAEFMGQAAGSWRGGREWSLELAGTLTHIDLHQLVSRSLHHTLYGEADCRLQTLRIENGRIADLVGVLSCRQGQIDRPLIAAAEREFGWQQFEQAERWPVAFRDWQIAFATSAGAEWLRLQSPRQDGLIALREDGSPWLWESSQPTVSILSLLRWLVPPGDTTVPLTRESAPLADLLPLPSQNRPPPTASGASRLRLEQ